MLDIGFLELMLVSIVALLVIGPEKLPGAIRTLGLWVGRLRRMFTNIQRDIEHELRAEEMRQKMQAQMDEIQSLKSTVEAQIQNNSNTAQASETATSSTTTESTEKPAPALSTHQPDDIDKSAGEKNSENTDNNIGSTSSSGGEKPFFDPGAPVSLKDQEDNDPSNSKKLN